MGMSNSASLNLDYACLCDLQNNFDADFLLLPNLDKEYYAFKENFLFESFFSFY